MKNYVEALFTEPRGRGTGLLFLSFTLFCLLGWVFFAVVHDGGHLMLFLGIGFALQGTAESLPSDRRRSAGVLRVVAACVFLAELGLVFVAPEIVLG